MLRISLSVLAFALMLSTATQASLAQWKPKPPAYLSAEEGGHDFATQGEYYGLLSGGFRRQPLGVQVVARGDGQFHFVWLCGGLPGSGWDGSEPVMEFDAESIGSLVTFTAEPFTGVVINDTIWLRDARSGTLRSILRKVHRQSPTMGATPPPGAEVLFDGSPDTGFADAKISEEGLLTEGPVTKNPVGDFKMHLEFRTPFMPTAGGQARGNSGVYIQRRYGVQILDSFGLEGVHNECGGLYKQKAPDLNMCLPPLSWQTYDIDFRTARFDAQGEKIENARITVRHNGVPIHDDHQLTNKTGAGQPEGPQKLPILLQNHGNPVRYRNIWILHGQSEEIPQPVEVLQ